MREITAEQARWVFEESGLGGGAQLLALHFLAYGIEFHTVNIFAVQGRHPVIPSRADLDGAVAELIRAGFLRWSRDDDSRVHHFRVVWPPDEPDPRAPVPTNEALIPASTRRRILKRDGAFCAFCGATESLHIDHIIPYSHGGSNWDENLRVLCRACNLGRPRRSFQEPSEVTQKMIRKAYYAGRSAR